MINLNGLIDISQWPLCRIGKIPLYLCCMTEDTHTFEIGGQRVTVSYTLHEGEPDIGLMDSVEIEAIHVSNPDILRILYEVSEQLVLDLEDKILNLNK